MSIPFSSLPRFRGILWQRMELHSGPGQAYGFQAWLLQCPDDLVIDAGEYALGHLQGGIIGDPQSQHLLDRQVPPFHLLGDLRTAPMDDDGLYPKLTSRAMSLANRSSSPGSSMELPPNLITTFFPLNLEARGYRAIMLSILFILPQVV